MSGPPSPQLPLALFAAIAAADAFFALYRRRSPSPPWWSLWTGHIARPLAALALCNGLYRLWPATFKFNRLTFPLWANLWSESGVSLSGRLPRTVAAVAACALVIFVLRRCLAGGGTRPAALIALWAALLAAQGAMALAPAGWYGLTLPWTAPGKVYAWAARKVDSAGGAGAFLDRYDEIQPLQPVHARSHPPGATLLSRWTQSTGDPGSKGNVVRLLLMTSLNVPLLFLFGRSVRSPRVGLAAAALSGCMPATVAFGTYSQDTVYALFFLLYLYLSWEISLRARARHLAVPAGVVLYCLSMLTFSWSIVAAAAFAFVAIARLRRGSPLPDLVVDLALPPLVMLCLHAAVGLGFGFDYYAAYRESYAFHSRYYRFAGPSDWVKALLGGQIEFLWGMGPLAAGALVSLLSRGASRGGGHRPFAVLLWSVLACYGLAVVAGPNPLKLETARCWYWLTAPALVAAALFIDEKSPDDDRPLLLAAGSSLVAALLGVSFLNFGA